jgi:hypothetical protein
MNADETCVWKNSAKKIISQQSDGQRDERVAVRAHQLWTQRGCHIGSPEIDWFQAESERCRI